MTEEDEVEALYAAPLASFIDARKAAAARLKAAGDKAAAARLVAIAKPTPAAWAVNHLWRAKSDAFAALLDVGDELRGALRDAFAGRGKPGGPAALQKAQRDAVTSLVAAAGEALQEIGASGGQVVLDRVATTLRSISTTGSWGDVAPGRLARELGEADLASIATLLVDEKSARPARAPASARPGKVETAKKSAPRSSHQRLVRGSEPPAKDAAISKVDAARRAKKLEEARAEVEEATAEERGARKAAREATDAADQAKVERESAQKAIESLRKRADVLHQAAEEAAREARDAQLELKKSVDAIAALERAETNAARAVRSAGIAVEQAETRLAAARAARDEAAGS